MAIVSTKAIVLSTLKYSDTSLIVKCFTELEGIKSYLVRGVMKPKKRGMKIAHFQPLNQLHLIANHTQRNSLNSIKELQVYHSYKTIYNDVVKQSIVMFLAEMLTNSIQEEEENKKLYSYIEESLMWIDAHTQIANFHLIFLLQLTRFLGFYPDETDKGLSSFDLSAGIYSNNVSNNSIHNKELKLFNTLLGTNFVAIASVRFNKSERQLVLQILIRYFELHLDGFRKPKSLQILEMVFS